jgi:hypothetical protein
MPFTLLVNSLWFPETRIWLIHWQLSLIRFFTSASTLMAILAAVRDCLCTRAALQIEVLALHHQLNVLQRSVKRRKLTAADRFLWARLSRFWTGWRSALVMVKPETVIAWHRKGFRVAGPGRCAAASWDDRLSPVKYGT